MDYPVRKKVIAIGRCKREAYPSAVSVNELQSLHRDEALAGPDASACTLLVRAPDLMAIETVTDDAEEGGSMKFRISRGQIFKWMAISAAAAVALHQFFVRELIAELLLFAAVFGSIAAAVLFLLAIGQAWQFAFEHAEIYIRAHSRPASSDLAPVKLVH